MFYIHWIDILLIVKMVEQKQPEAKINYSVAISAGMARTSSVSDYYAIHVSRLQANGSFHCK